VPRHCMPAQGHTPLYNSPAMMTNGRGLLLVRNTPHGDIYQYIRVPPEGCALRHSLVSRTPRSSPSIHTRFRVRGGASCRILNQPRVPQMPSALCPC
jgi:hypothetical protein